MAENDMILTCIGTGTAVPEPDRVCSGYLLEVDGLRILLDCGGGVVHSMARLGVRWQEITHLLLTHFHNDHIGDVPLLFFGWKHGMRPGRSQPLTIIGPKGTRKLISRMADIFGGHLEEPGFEIHWQEIDGDHDMRLSDAVRLSATRTKHTDHSVAWRVEADGRSFCYTGDTGMDRELAIFAQSADTLLMECSLPDGESMPTHLTPTGVADMARIALPKRLLLTHIYPQLGRDAVGGLVREAGWPGRLEVAAEGDRIVV
jgi:ribonuclease BN (tRNA processing enzyme)